MDFSTLAVGHYVRLLCVFAGAATSQGFSGFGLAVLWNSGMRLTATVFGMSYDPAKVVALLGAGEIFVATVLVVAGFATIDRHVAALMGFPLVVGSFLGNFLMNHVDMVIVGRTIGSLILAKFSWDLVTSMTITTFEQLPGAVNEERERERDRGRERQRGFTEPNRVVF